MDFMGPLTQELKSPKSNDACTKTKKQFHEITTKQTLNEGKSIKLGPKNLNEYSDFNK